MQPRQGQLQRREPKSSVWSPIRDCSDNQRKYNDRIEEDDLGEGGREHTTNYSSPSFLSMKKEISLGRSPVSSLADEIIVVTPDGPIGQSRLPATSSPSSSRDHGEASPRRRTSPSKSVPAPGCYRSTPTRNSHPSYRPRFARFSAAIPTPTPTCFAAATSSSIAGFATVATTPIPSCASSPPRSQFAPPARFTERPVHETIAVEGKIETLTPT